MARKEAPEEAVTGEFTGPYDAPAETAAPAEAAEEQPTQGGSYLRREDGSLELVHRTAHAGPEQEA